MHSLEWKAGFPRAWQLALAIAVAFLCHGCSLSSHRTGPSPLGQPVTLAALEATLDQPGPMELEVVASADWQVPLGGLLNLDAAAAKQAGLADREEPIRIYAHILRHPSRGAFLVDSGLSRQVLADPGAFGIHWLMRRMMNVDQLEMRQPAEDIVGRLGDGLQGVFLTHLHIDHITGMPAVPSRVPLYVGRGEATHRSFQNLFVQGVTDSLLAGKAPLLEWDFAGDPEQPLSSVIDVFGDGSLYALNVPGHTPGSTAYIVRTPTGPVLLTGDTCHTRWGWENGVEPGSFTEDQPRNRQSLLALKELARRHPRLEVRLGHQ